MLLSLLCPLRGQKGPLSGPSLCPVCTPFQHCRPIARPQPNTRLRTQPATPRVESLLTHACRLNPNPLDPRTLPSRSPLGPGPCPFNTLVFRPRHLSSQAAQQAAYVPLASPRSALSTQLRALPAPQQPAIRCIGFFQQEKLNVVHNQRYPCPLPILHPKFCWCCQLVLAYTRLSPVYYTSAHAFRPLSACPHAVFPISQARLSLPRCLKPCLNIEHARHAAGQTHAFLFNKFL